MKTKFFSAAIAAATIGLAGFASPSLAQMQTNPAPAGMGQAPGGAGGMAARPTAAVGNQQLGINGIAVVDVAYIFKNYTKFKGQMEAMKGKVDAAEAQLKKDQDDMKKKADQMKTFQPGTPDYKRIESELLKAQTDWNVNKAIRGKEFMEQEGQVYFNVSREIDMVVKQLAMQSGIVMVLKFNGDPVDPNDHNDILRGINKPIVYFDPRMDITPNVLDQLNRGTVGTGNVGVRMPQPGATPAPR